MRKLILLLTCVLIMVVLIVGCAQPTPTTPTSPPTPTPPAPTPPKEFLISGSPGGGAAQSVTIAVGEILNKYVTTPYKLDAVVQPITAMLEGPKRIKSGDCDIAWTAASTANLAALGIGPYADFGKVPMRVLFWGDPYASHIYTTNAKIKSVSDFKGKKVAADQIGSPPTLVTMKTIMEAYGVTTDDIKLMSYKNIGECSQLVKEGLADVGMVNSSFPAVSVEEIAASKPVYVISLDNEKLQNILQKLGAVWTGVTMPANTYKGQTNNVLTTGGYVVFISSPDLDDTLAYSIVKAIYDHQQEFGTYHAAAKRWTLDRAIALWAIPYHPGAIKYYKEKGIWTSEMDTKQAALIEKFK